MSKTKGPRIPEKAILEFCKKGGAPAYSALQDLQHKTLKKDFMEQTLQSMVQAEH
jgi:uncharacterized membrane protein YsdA (DUF1294 family)